MRAAWYTETMLAAWRSVGVDRADLALRRPPGTMLWQRDLALEDLPLAWARAENAHGADVYVRPARGRDWPLVFLDDVAPQTAQTLAREHGGLAVQTSPAGGCHLWLPTPRPLDEEARHRAQRWLAEKHGADLGSISGEHLGRLAGFKNWKRDGCWVNVLVGPVDGATDRRLLTFPTGLLDPQPASGRWTSRPAPDGITTHFSGGDSSQSGQEWGWACRMLEWGWPPERVYEALVEKARPRRGLDAERYARRTTERALERVRARLG